MPMMWVGTIENKKYSHMHRIQATFLILAKIIPNTNRIPNTYISTIYGTDNNLKI